MSETKLKRLKDPFDLEYPEHYALKEKYGSVRVDKEEQKLINKRYSASVRTYTPKCCKKKMKHLGDKLSGAYSGTHDFYYYHVYQCSKCQTIKESCYKYKSYDDDNR